MLKDFQQRFAGRAFTVADVAREYSISVQTTAWHLRQMSDALTREFERRGKRGYYVYKIKDDARIEGKAFVRRRDMLATIRDKYGDGDFTIKEIARDVGNSFESARKMIRRLCRRGALYMREIYAARGKKVVYSTKEKREPCWLERFALVFENKPFRTEEACRALGTSRAELSRAIPASFHIKRGWWRLPQSFVDSVADRWQGIDEEEGRCELQLFGSVRERYEQIRALKVMRYGEINVDNS